MRKSKLSLIFLLMFTSMAHAAPKALTIAEKRIRLNRALKIATTMVETALDNPKYTAKIRPSTQASGPKDIRKILERFLLEMPPVVTKSLFVYDGSGYSNLACARKGDIAGVVNGVAPIYICNYAFERDDEGIAETLIHEFTHLVGYSRHRTDECSATEVAMHAVIARGGNPLGNSYTHSFKECLKMDASIGKLAAELRDPNDQATSIKVGARIVFSETLNTQISADLTAAGMYMRTGPVDQEIEISGNSGASRAPREPLVVKINKSENDRVEFVLVDAEGFEFNFIAMGISQVALPLSTLKKYGISFEATADSQKSASFEK